MPYTSTNPSVASVDQNGKVTANAAGSATIKYTTNTGVLSKQGKITVVQTGDPSYVPTTGIKLSKKTVTLTYTPTSMFGYVYIDVLPANATNKVVKASISSDVCLMPFSSSTSGHTAKLELWGVKEKNPQPGTYTLTVQAADGQTDTCAVKIIKDGVFVQSVSPEVVTMPAEGGDAETYVNYQVWNNVDCGLDAIKITTPGTKVDVGSSDYYLIRNAKISQSVKKNYGGPLRSQRIIRGAYESVDTTYDYATETYTNCITLTINQDGCDEISGFSHGAEALYSAAGNIKTGTALPRFLIGRGMIDSVMAKVTKDSWISFRYDPIDDSTDNFRQSRFTWYNESGVLEARQGLPGQSGQTFSMYYVGIAVDANTSTESRTGWIKFPGGKWFKVTQEGASA